VSTKGITGYQKMQFAGTFPASSPKPKQTYAINLLFSGLFYF
jgi:hypothetical protein